MRKVLITACILLLGLIGFTIIHNVTSNTADASATTETASSEETTSELITTEKTDISAATVTDTADITFEAYNTDNASLSDAEEYHIPPNTELELTILNQYPEMPAGCESVSLTMLLNYYGYDLDKTYIADNYLIYSDNFVTGYYGNPYSSTGGGCYAPGMTDTANNFLIDNGGEYHAENITGTDFDDLLTYVADGTPVLIWTTIGMGSSSRDYTEYYYDGDVYYWDFMEHCVVLTGYDLDNNTVTVYDPIDGVVTRDKDAFESTYNAMFQMSVILIQN